MMMTIYAVLSIDLEEKQSRCVTFVGARQSREAAERLAMECKRDYVRDYWSDFDSGEENPELKAELFGNIPEPTTLELWAALFDSLNCCTIYEVQEGSLGE